MVDHELVSSNEENELLRIKVEDKFRQLSPDNLEVLRQIGTFTEAELSYIRQALNEAGVNLDLNDEQQASLSSSEFRTRPDKLDFSEGRGPGIVAVLGKERAERLVNWSYETAIKFKWKRVKIEGIDKTQGRGIQQAAADIISVAVFGYDGQAPHLEKLSKRAWVGLRRKHVFSQIEKIITIENTFTDLTKPKKPKDFSSLPPGTLLLVWQHIATKQQEEVRG